MRLSNQLYIARQCLFLRGSQWWPQENIVHYQAKCLIRMMRFAVTNVPFYRSLGIRPGSIESDQDLTRFPVITKSMIQGYGDDFLADGVDKVQLFSSRTSGSTGEPTVTFFDLDCWLLSKYALKLRRMLAAVNPFFKRILIVSEQEVQGRSCLSKRRLGLGALTGRWEYLSIHQEVNYHVSVILDYRPDVIYAFPSYLLELLQAFWEGGIAAPKVPIIFTSSEVLTKQARKTIENGFQGRVIDIYGSTEFKEIAWQCNQSRYHLNFENIYVERRRYPEVADDRHALVVSSLHNYAMPLLRFDLRDVAEIGTGRCLCGRQSPYLYALEGRQACYIDLPNGRRISPYRLTMVIEAHPGIKKYQIVQTDPSSLRIDFVAFKNAAFELGLESLEAELAQVLKEPVKLRFREVESIPRSTGGKHQVVRKEA